MAAGLEGLEAGLQGEQLSAARSPPLVSAEAVLSKLKSDGTFDHIRKMCVAAVQEEPSYRAQKEHVEIITRRFLHDYRWKEGTNKNEVRSKLRSHVLEELKKPSVHVGASLNSLITRVLESEATDLLPTIKNAVEAMLHPPTPVNSGSSNTTDTPATMLPSSSYLSVPTSDAGTAGSSGHTSTAGSLELPIHLLEFSSSSLPVKKDSFSSRPGKGKTRASVAGDKKDTGTSGPKKSETQLKPTNKEERQDKHLQRESKRSENRQHVEKEMDGEAKQRTNGKTDLTDVSVTSHKPDREATISSSDKSDVVSETKPSYSGGKNRKRHLSLKDDSQQSAGKRQALSVIRRQVRKRRVVISSTSEEEEDDEEKEPDSPSEPEAHLTENKDSKQQQDMKAKSSREQSKEKEESVLRDLSVVVTRYNRRVKPNRRYAQEEEEEEEVKEEERQRDAKEVEGVSEEEEEQVQQKQPLKRTMKSKSDQEEPVAKRLRRHR